MSTSPSKGPASCPAPADHPAVELAPGSPPGSIDTFLHALDGKVRLDQPISIEEINRIVAMGWANSQTASPLSSLAVKRAVNSLEQHSE